MDFRRNHELWTYDVFPKVFEAGKEAEIHIHYTGGRKSMSPEQTYEATVMWMSGSNGNYPATEYKRVIPFNGTEEGSFTVKVELPHEGEYHIWCCFGTFSVYAVSGDLVGVYPFMGDLHLHSTYSDGSQTPEFVASSYRAHGCDFLAITDHYRYYPSLRVMESFKDIPNELTLLTGEEVQLPAANGLFTPQHTISIGAEYSINAMISGTQTDEVGTDPSTRSLFGKCPDVMSQDEFGAKMAELTAQIEVPDNVEAHAAAQLKWIHDEIRRANGLGIFVHPNWIDCSTYHTPTALNDWLVENKIFDAFEVLGGEDYFEQNGLQSIRYYEDMARGHKYPIVGSTDSHDATIENRIAFLCSTMVFSPENERCALIDSIKKLRSVAVDTLSKEFRVVGELRYATYACFLLQHYFPMHDDACFEEGRLMKQAVYGTEEEKEEAIKALGMMNGRMKRMREKYFAF